MSYTKQELGDKKLSELRAIAKELNISGKAPTESLTDFIERICKAQNNPTNEVIFPDEHILFEEPLIINSSSDDLTKPEVDFKLKGSVEFYQRNGIPYCDVCNDIIKRDLSGRKTCRRLDCPNR